MEQSENNFSAALAAGSAIAAPRSPLEHELGTLNLENGTPYVVVPEGFKVADLEKLLPLPTRKRAQVVLTDSPSFVTYLKKHGIHDGSMVYADIDSERSRFNLVAVIDDHLSYQASWREHRAQFNPKISVEWARWTKQHKLQMTQAEFATWLVDNLGDVATVDGMPSGAQILAMALGFEANADKKLRSKINLQSGSWQLVFMDEEKNDTRTTMQFFERFTLGIPVFEGSTNAYPLEARLKYREKGGVLSFWFELICPHRVFKTAVTAELEAISAETDYAFPIVSGIPN